MTKKLVVVDLDATVVELHPQWYGQYNAAYGDDLTIEKVATWDVYKYAKHGKAVYKTLERPGFFRELPPMPGAVDAVRTIHDAGHKIVIATTSPRDAGHDKIEWVDEHLPFIGWKRVRLLHDDEAKGELFGDVLLDDGPHNIRMFRERNPRSFIAAIEFPHNWHMGSHANLLAKDWRDPAAAWKSILRATMEFLGS